VRLVGGRNSLEGVLQRYRNSSYFLYGWGSVCDEDFDDAAARVVCYMLGSGYVNVTHSRLDRIIIIHEHMY